MAKTSIRVRWRQSTSDDNRGMIYYQLIKERKVKCIGTEHHCPPPYTMDDTDEKPHEIKNLKLPPEVKEPVRWDLERLQRIVKKWDDECVEFNLDDVAEEFEKYKNRYSLFNYMEELIVRLKLKKKIRTAETYRAAINSFKKFRNDEDIMIDSITSDVMESYEAWHRERGNTANTISFYLRILRAVYNRAIEDGVIENRFPFRRVFTGISKTIKRAIPLESISRLKNLDLKKQRKLDFARDIFMMSFYLRGMSFIDMAYLKKSNLKNGTLTYRRKKTNQLLTIKWTREMQSVLDKYGENPTEYLMPIIKRDDVSDRNTYRTMSHNINRSLKELAGMIGVGLPLTLYVARHSWASAARTKGIPLGVISEGMGHDKESTTRIYLASLETAVVDEANSLIMSSL